jgi:RNA polymerase sigma factor (sigma-70 family)
MSEELLLEGLKAKEERAFSVFYDRYAPTLLGIIVRIVRDPDQAEDLLQDTFVKIWKNIHQYDPNRGRLFTWMLNIARNTALNSLRSTNNVGASQIQTLDSVVYTETAKSEPIDVNHLGMTETVQRLDPKHREVVDLIYFLGYTQQEVADQLQLPLGTVKTRTRTALQQLKHYFQ